MTPSRDYIFDRVLTLVAAGFDVPRAKIMVRDRHMEASLARQAVMYLLRENCGYSNAMIGKLLGRGTSNVQYGISKIRGWGQNDPMRKRIAAIGEQVDAVAHLTFPECVKSTVVIRSSSGRARTPVEAFVERVTALGDGVKLKINGKEPFWACQRDYLILDKLT